MSKRSSRQSKRHIARAWADPVYRASLTAAEREQLPAHPSGEAEDVLDEVRGWGTSLFTCMNTCAFSCTCSCGCFTRPYTTCEGC